MRARVCVVLYMHRKLIFNFNANTNSKNKCSRLKVCSDLLGIAERRKRVRYQIAIG